ncbi:MAG TPA: peptidoglycan DD-metalloendopeptidase family protein [Bordetella sp.]
MPGYWASWCRRAACAALLAALAACSSTPSSSGKSPAYYRVKEGDTLSQIAQKHDQSTGDLLRWNKLTDANQITPGMLLRVRPPFHDASSKGDGAPPPRASGKGDKPAPRTGAAAPASAPVHGITLVWPAQGKLLAGYNGSSSKGLTITGSTGAPVVAAAPGTVAYANSGLRGYGNLVIVRHENNFLTIYAHNSRLLVKQGDRVKRGQRIAEMGSSDARRVELYFELRQGGQPVNPMGVLPKQ